MRKPSFQVLLTVATLMLINSSNTFATSSQANLYETIKGFSAEGSWEGISSSYGKIIANITFNATDISSG